MHRTSLKLGTSIQVQLDAEAPAAIMNNSGGDRNTSNPTTDDQKVDNPFVQFRRFADEQIGSVLQGIIGLPSALARLPDFGRRLGHDGEHMRQSPSEPQGPEMDEADIPYTDVCGAGFSYPSPNSSSYTPLSQLVNQATRELPLYSPLKGNLFQRGTLSRLLEMPCLPQVISDGRIVQLWAYDAFQEGQWGCTRHSPPSLLGYLMNSPYSPVHLTSHPDYIKSDGFCYQAAFDDLISTSLGMDIANGLPIRDVPCRMRNGNDVALFNIEWIYDLHSHLMLLPDKFPAWFRLAHAESTFRPEIAIRWNLLQHICERSLAQLSESLNLPSTEQEMHDFLHEQDEEDDCIRPDPTAPGYEGMVQEAERFLQRQTKILEEARASFTAHQSKAEVGKSMSGSTTGLNRVVATYKTVRQCTHEDGSSESEVEVTTRFADGRETTSTSSHCEEGQARSGEGFEQRKKGWFWS